MAAPTDEEIEAFLESDADAIKARYDKDVLRYRTPQMVQARQILRALPADATDADVAKERGLLLELKTQIDEGADFAAIAAANSQDEETKAKGGDLGQFKRGQMPKPIEDAAFGLKKDEVTAEPVRTSKGLHLLQVTEITPPARKPLDEVKVEVATAMLRETAGETQAKANAEALLASLQEGKTLEELTISEEESRENPEAEEPVRRDTAWILASQDALPRIGASAELHEAVFSATIENPVVPAVHKVGRSWFVSVLKDRELPDMEKFAEEKDTLRQTAVWSKRSALFREWVGHLRERANVRLNPSVFPPEA